MFKADSPPIVGIRYIAYIDINCWNFSIVLIIICGVNGSLLAHTPQCVLC